jgi:asparaginyl-tRNA synthetase
MLEPEVAYADLDDNMRLAEDLVESIVGRILDKRKEELKILERDTAPLEKVKVPFPRITYDEAVAILKSKKVPFEDGNDFGGTDETVISEQFDRPVMVHRYPAAVKAFYMKNDPKDPSKALGVDMLAPEGYGEIIGGGQREDDYDTLVQKIKNHNLPMEAFGWYLDLRKYGSVPHSGFGIGVERTLSWICKLDHIRETIPFPRMMHRIMP